MPMTMKEIPDGPQRLASARAGERDRSRVEQQRERGQHIAAVFRMLRPRLGGIELLGLHHLDRGRLVVAALRPASRQGRAARSPTRATM